MGNVSPPVPNPHIHDPYACCYHGAQFFHLRLGYSQEGDVPVTKYVRPEHAGLNVLRVVTDLPCKRPEAFGDQDHSDEAIQASSLRLQTRFEFPLTIHPQDDAILLETARRLETQFLVGPNIAKRKEIADALCAIPTEPVEPVLHSLAVNPVADRIRLAEALSELQILKAADLIAEIAFLHPVFDREGNEYPIGDMLRQMDKEGTPEMKQHLQGLLKKYDQAGYGPRFVD